MNTLTQFFAFFAMVFFIDIFMSKTFFQGVTDAALFVYFMFAANVYSTPIPTILSEEQS